MDNLITETFTISASPDVMKRFRRFLALLHCNSTWGHSATFCMPLDGDGSDRFKIKDFKVDDVVASDVQLIGSVGFTAEVAGQDSYFCKELVGTPRFYEARNCQLLRDGVVIRDKRK